jgi:hypothetical protein
MFNGKRDDDEVRVPRNGAAKPPARETRNHRHDDS